MFKNEIKKSNERCGFASGGKVHYLENSDSKNQYRVIVNEKKLFNGRTNIFQRIFTMEAGGRKRLGCTKSSSIPVSIHSWEVVSEMNLS